jgi:DNA-binding transcriptional LysR family regulator
MVDSAEIEVFLALAEELHFGRTASRLYMPQPRVSRLLAALEQKVGGKLFDRTSRVVRLTPLGSQFRAQLAPGWAQVTAAYEAARAVAREVAGELRLGFAVTTPHEALAQLVEAFEASHPECRVILVEHLITGDDWAVWEPLRHGESDALLYWNVADGEPDLTSGPVLAWLDRVLLVGRRHRLAGRDVVHAEELADEVMNACPPTLPLAVMDALCPPLTPAGLPIPRTVQTRSMHEVLSQVARGQVVHPTAVGAFPSIRDNIKAVPLTGWPPVPLGLTWSTAHENARVRALAQTVTTLASSIVD